MPTSHILMTLFAHPDDETVCSGVMAQAVRAGMRVVHVCATRGEAGEIASPELATPQTLGQVREGELRSACANLGVTDVRFLDYCDSGMEGTPENENPRSFKNADPEEVIAKIAALMQEIQPDVVITFEPYGVYGHPDHLAISRLTTQAFTRTATAAGASRRLYYSGMPHTFFETLRQILTDLGKPPAFMENFNLDQEDGFGKTVSHTVEVSDLIELKLQSMQRHRTQMGPDSPFVQAPPEVMARTMKSEYFAQVYPVPEPGKSVEAISVFDLFPGAG